MKHTTLVTDDVPQLPQVMDRRRARDRRAVWRGGRRDSDWIRRPLGAWDRFELAARPASGFRRMLASLHLA